jgi:hypothetical protein
MDQLFRQTFQARFWLPGRQHTFQAANYGAVIVAVFGLELEKFIEFL